MGDELSIWVMAGYGALLAGVLYLTARQGERRSEHPSMILGIRTSATTRSPEHWYQAHRAARRTCLIGAAAVLLGLPVMFAIAWTTGDPGLAAAIGIGLMVATLVVATIPAGVIGHRAAARLDDAAS